MERTIRVTGTGKLSLKPDTIRLIITLKNTCESYPQALENSQTAASRLKEAFTGADFGREDLKTLSFSVNSKYEGGPDEKGIYRQRLAGFEYDYRMSLDLPQDNNRLGQVLTALLNSSVSAEFSLQYTVRDPEPAKAELLKRAVLDSKSKAQGLASAAGVGLGKVLQINYAWQDRVFRSEVMQSSRALGVTAFAGFQPDLEPADIELEESVRIVWEIL